MSEKNQTKFSFSEKWENNQALAFEETLRSGSKIHDWILNRNGFSNLSEFQGWLKNRTSVLDAGCGNGRVTALLRENSDISTKITGIDLTAAHIAESNLKHYKNLEFKQKDLLGDLKDIGEFGLIYCQEVLHHTANPKKAFLNLCELLSESGEIAIYVYKKKAPVREYCDDFIRDQVSQMNYEDAMKSIEQITEFGKILSELDLKIEVPDLDLIEIKAGKYDIQRLIYHFFMKCFWNDDMSFDDNNAINYDWYHPQLCSRHTPEEIRTWFEDAGLNIIHEYVDHYGITMRGSQYN